MNIDDFLRLEQFKPLDDYLTAEMHKVADKNLISLMVDTFETEEKARKWFYTSIRALGGKRPYDFCRKGDHEEVKQELGRIGHGGYS